MFTDAVTFKNYSDDFSGVWGFLWVFLVAFFPKKKKLGLFRNPQFHFS